MSDLECPACSCYSVSNLYQNVYKCSECSYIFSDDEEPMKVPSTKRTKPRRSDYDLDD